MGGGVIEKLTMPKWGLSMTEAKVVQWLVAEGAEVVPGTEVVEVETEKITGAVESTVVGVLRRQVATVGQDIPVAGLLAVIADASVPDEEIDQLVESDSSHDVLEEGTSEDPSPECVEVAGRTLRFLKQGDGDAPVLLIHGFAGDLNSWLFTHGTLAANRSVFALDLPGHGQSAKDVGDGTIDTFVEAVRAWMDAVGLSRVHLIGHSLGGAIVLSLALQHPDRAISCTLIASAGLGPEIDSDYIQGIVSSDRRNQLKPHLQKLFADPALVNRQLIDDMLKFKRLDGVRESLNTIAESFLTDGRQSVVLRDQLDQLSAPLLVIWGAQDRIVPASHAQGLPGSSTVKLFDHCGHMVQMEAAGEVNRAIAQFLAEVEESLDA